jgi:biopolymer transport protein ExbD
MKKVLFLFLFVILGAPSCAAGSINLDHAIPCLEPQHDTGFKGGPIDLTVDADGRTYWNGMFVDPETLSLWFADLGQSDPQNPVLIDSPVSGIPFRVAKHILQNMREKNVREAWFSVEPGNRKTGRLVRIFFCMIVLGPETPSVNIIKASIEPSGSVVWNGAVVSLDVLKVKAGDAAGEQEKPVVYVYVNPDTNLSTVARVLERIRSAGINWIFID